MKWKDFEQKHPKDLYSELRQMCEEIHSKGSRFCNWCYKRDGWYCFPCNDIKERYEELHGKSLDDIISNKKE
ncbi:MAG: hypothetical protein ACETWM_08265 [Candidatus Lokiarchaeia archaeon]